MITLRDLQNRVYSDKDCIRFEYAIPVEDNEPIIATFSRKTIPGHELHQWNMRIIINRTRDKDSEVYNFSYVMPRNGLPLELIAATGLRFFQLYLKEEVQAKSNLDFELGNTIQGM